MNHTQRVFGGPELRKATRSRVRLPATYRLVKDDGERATRNIDSEAMDISLLGMKLQTDELETEGLSLLPAMEPDNLTRIDLEVDLGQSRHALNATGRVVWVRRSTAGARRKYTAGVVFSYLNADSQTALRAFMDSRQSS